VAEPSPLRAWLRERNRAFAPLVSELAPLDLRIVGRTLLHAALVGLCAGLLGALFFKALELLQQLLLEDLAGYVPLRAHGEASHGAAHPVRFWLLMLLPALGGLACGLLTRLAPETRGGGGDAMIEAFHHRGGVIRARVIGLKLLASVATLGTGGAGGREGPTMQIGGALGSTVGRLLSVAGRERRILLVAGVAAGISAVFRTPLGAALLAVEILYRDGFESDALVPSILASVVSYSVVISLFGETTLFAHAARFPFVPAHLPLYALLPLLLLPVAALFLSGLRRSRALFSALPVPQWMRPAAGGLVLGLFACAALWEAGVQLHHQPGQGLGILGGGYGAVQLSISGATWLPAGWGAVELLAALAFAKLLAASLTIGSEGSAGDFAPSLAIGGLLGGAFGRAALLLTGDPRLDPGAFALVGMGAFYGGIAHAPLSALVLVCELAGNYDLLVPLMCALGIAFVVMRRLHLYPAQVPSHASAAAPVPQEAPRVRELMLRPQTFAWFEKRTPAAELLRHLGEATWQDTFPVLDAGRLVGLVTGEGLQLLAVEQGALPSAIAADLMLPPVSVAPGDDLRRAAFVLVQNELREVPVVEGGQVVGFLDEAKVAEAYARVAGAEQK
jgi:chloride channel protein, CIC family